MMRRRSRRRASASPGRPTGQTRQFWTPEEDARLKLIVQDSANLNWSVIGEAFATFFPGRTGKSCRARFLSRLRETVNNKRLEMRRKTRSWNSENSTEKTAGHRSRVILATGGLNFKSRTRGIPV